MKKLIAIAVLFMQPCIQANNLLKQLSNTSILKNKQQVQSIMMEAGFKKVFFKTKDDYKIAALYLDKSQTSLKPVKGTIIFAAGFYPGTKEGMATFYAMLEKEAYNFLFFDARCHSESSGSLLNYNYMKQYGTYEYLDIIAAIEWLNLQNTTGNISPSIILHGVCAGAFHAVKATSYMQHQQHPLQKHIKGIIFDSGWAALSEIAEPTITAEINKTLQHTCIKNLRKPTIFIVNKLYEWTLKKYFCNVETINNHIAKINCPILFIHSLGDDYAPVQPVLTLAKSAQKATTWLDNSSSHATCHLKQQTQYIEQIKQFFKDF